MPVGAVPPAAPPAPVAPAPEAPTPAAPLVPAAPVPMPPAPAALVPPAPARMVPPAPAGLVPLAPPALVPPPPVALVPAPPLVSPIPAPPAPPAPPVPPVPPVPGDVPLSTGTEDTAWPHACAPRNPIVVARMAMNAQPPFEASILKAIEPHHLSLSPVETSAGDASTDDTCRAECPCTLHAPRPGN